MISTKPPKFLLCENPMADEIHGHREFVLHTRYPVIIAQIIDCSDMTEDEQMKVKSEITVGSMLDLDQEYYVFNAIYIEPGYGANTDAQKIADNLAGIMRRMADWYEAYIKWEDNQR